MSHSLPSTPPSRGRTRRSARVPIALGLGAALALAACQPSLLGKASGTDPDGRAATGGSATITTGVPIGPPVVAFEGGLLDGWQDFGWAATVDATGARLDVGGWGGWILARPGVLTRSADLELRLRLPDGVDPEGLLRAGYDDGTGTFGTVAVVLTDAGDGVWTATVPGAALNPGNRPFDRLSIQAAREVPAGTVLVVERVALIPVAPAVPTATGTDAVSVRADCVAPGHDISPYIYGVAFSASREGSDDEPWGLGTTIRRWGGNPTSRYNWQDGHAWNTAADWYWRNVAILPGEDPAWQQFLEANARHDVAGAVTVPIIGWVAKDSSSYSFPVTELGEQQDRDPDLPDAGNGVDPDGDPIAPPDPSATSIEAAPSFVGEWVEAMSRATGAPVQYILDNEPDLWHDTHRDVHPAPVTYDELLDRTIAYGTAVREADPDASIAGPASWGWWGYFYSAADAEAGFGSRPDRRAHGDQELLAWYIDQLRAHREQTGVRVLDVLDVHYYPQAAGVYDPDGSGSDAETGRRRVEATRSLWDPSYVDDSWIDDEIRLLPRLQELIDEHDPSLELSIGEYSFGGEHVASGAVAQAEALGRFAEYDVHSAFYWTYPPVDSAVGAAFRAYTDFDGQGGRFLDTWVPSTGAGQVSLFTSTDGTDVVAVLVNRSDTTAAAVSAAFAGCGDLAEVAAYQYDGSATDLAAVPATIGADGAVSVNLPPWSVTTIRLTPRG
ncbi:MAG: glycoside hydrolase family 44 protein [Acidimicrobiia bacterium]